MKEKKHKNKANNRTPKKECSKTQTKNVGQPPKFDSKNHPKLIKYMAQAGLTDFEMSHELGISRSTFSEWKKKYKELSFLKDWKKVADERVERSLYERACGYKCYEDKVLQHEGRKTEVVRMVKEVPADTTAAIFWLKNRKPDEWKDKKDIDLTSKGKEIFTDEQIDRVYERRRKRKASGTANKS